MLKATKMRSTNILLYVKTLNVCSVSATLLYVMLPGPSPSLVRTLLESMLRKCTYIIWALTVIYLVHPACDQKVQGLMHFKNHAVTVHKVFL